jgi:hypothetical protein
MAAGATVFNSAGFSAFFKNRYPQKKIEDLVKFGKPTLSSIKKSDELVGTTTYVPIQLDSPQGISALLGDARTNVTGSIGRAWQITPAALYGALTIDARTMLGSRNTEGAFFKAREREFEAILEQMGQHNEMALWSDGTGSIGTLSADPSGGTTFTLADTADAIKFHEGMEIYFYSDSGGAPTTLRATEGARTVSAVNYSTGVVTVSGANIDAEVASGDHVVRTGNLDALFKGVPAWIPASDPTDTFLGVARTNYPQKLGGHRQSWLGTIEETVKSLDASIRRVNQKPKTLWLSYANFNRLDLELGARGYRMEENGKGQFGRVALKMTTPGGGVEVKAAPYLGDTAGYLLDMDTWKICHLGGFPHLVQDDGLAATRLNPAAALAGAANDGDGIEIRLRQFAQLLCTNPFANGRISIT